MNTFDDEFWSNLDRLVDESEIVIDRPKGSSHPKYPNFIYRLDYGYLKNTASMDGTGIDVWMGSREKRNFAINRKTRHYGRCYILNSDCVSAISFWNAVIDSSKTAIGLYPKEKIGFDSIVSICPANRLDTLITDWDASEADLKLFDEQGIKVVVVDKPE